MLFDPAQASAATIRSSYTTAQAGPFEVVRLEERRVLASGAWGTAATFDKQLKPSDGDPIGALSVPPVITAPGPQTTVEGSPLSFSAATGRLIRIDDPDIGALPLVVQISAFEAQGRVTPHLYFGSTAGLSVSGNGVNVYQFRGTLAAINNALSLVTFVGPDEGSFSLNIAASDNSTGESDSATVLIQVNNANPQLQIAFQQGSREGTVVEPTIMTFDPGPLDTVQLTWTVSYEGAIVAQGAGKVSFFAPNDGNYHLTVTAADGDGGVATAQRSFLVSNSDPSVSLTGAVRDGITYLTVSISDPGLELFSVEIFWSQNSSQSFQTTDHVFTVEHQYSPEELRGLVGTPTIEVSVSDDHANGRQTFNFANATPQDNRRPSIEPLDQEPPPERDPSAPVPYGGSPELIVSAELGGHGSSGKQDATAIYQFVVRLVGADGEESGNYPLPPEALADLPNYFKQFGVPDGHYRVYLVTGDLERLVVDGHFRGGHIVDPNEQTTAGLDLTLRDVQFPDTTDPRSTEIASGITPETTHAVAFQSLALFGGTLGSEHFLIVRNEDESADVAGEGSLRKNGDCGVAVAEQANEGNEKTDSDELEIEAFNLRSIATGVVIVAATIPFARPFVQSSNGASRFGTTSFRLRKSARRARTISRLFRARTESCAVELLQGVDAQPGVR